MVRDSIRASLCISSQRREELLPEARGESVTVTFTRSDIYSLPLVAFR